MKKRIVVDRILAERIDKLLSTEPKTAEECFGEDEVISVTASFGNGVEMDIKLCGVQFQEGESNLPWTEAVLFENGNEAGCSEVSDEFFGTWEIDGFCVEVVRAEDEEEDTGIYARCPKCGKRMALSGLPQYAFQCKECDEDFLFFEAKFASDEDKDNTLVTMWEALEDAPYNAEEEMFEENVYGIADEGEAPSRLDVWNWFDERYRTGIAGLMGLI